MGLLDGPPGPKERIKAVPIFDKLNSMQLHRLASAAASKTFRDGETIVQQGGVGDAMFIIQHGRAAASVDGVGVVDYLPGDFFGELALLTGQSRSASVHAVGDCDCLVLHAAAVAPILDASWGGKGELQRREEQLQRLPMFEMLSQGELRRLATQLERVSFADNGAQIIVEGEIGEAMYARWLARWLAASLLVLSALCSGAL